MTRHEGSAINREERLHTISELDPDFASIYGKRPSVQSTNNWLKRSLDERRSRYVGRAGALLGLLGAWLVNAVTANMKSLHPPARLPNRAAA